MRSEREIIELMKKTALEDEDIRALYIEGSRANPNGPKDIFQDYDIEFIVTDTKKYIEDKTWIDRFGKRLYMQYPDEWPGSSSDKENWYGWLMQFVDGVRIDLHVGTKEHALANLEMYEVLVDKDGILPKQKEDSDCLYWISKPTEEEFLCTCNEFWWCLNNVAKGLWREEIPYVMDMLDQIIRPQLKRLLEWKIGVKEKFQVSAGKFGKYMRNYLTEETYEAFLSTYTAAKAEEIWAAVFRMCVLFQQTAIDFANEMHFQYNFEEAENSRKFLEHVKELPKDATEI